MKSRKMVATPLLEPSMSIRRAVVRVVRWLLLLGVVGVVGTVAYVYGQQHRAHEELRAALAELDEREPDWRLDRILAARRDVPDDKNGALVIAAASKQIAEDWDNSVIDRNEDALPQCRLEPEIAAILRDQLKANAAAVDESRKLRNYATGRFPIEIAPDILSTKYEAQVDAARVMSLLVMDATIAAEDGKPERAMESTRAVVNLCRCYDNEPLLMPQLGRLFRQVAVVRLLERMVAQGAVADKDLADFQADLAREAAIDSLAIGMFGERGQMNAALTRLFEKQPIAEVVQSLGDDGKKSKPGWWDRAMEPRLRTMVDRSIAWILRHETKVIETAKLPGHARYVALGEIGWESRMTTSFDLLLARLMVPGIPRIVPVEQRSHSLLRCAVAGCAAERHRQKHGRWPADLDELVKTGFLAAVPEDLYADKPLELRRAADGIVIHSVGQRRNYEGDMLDPDTELEPWVERSERTEFRLWDPASRRQAPPAKKADDAPPP
jgi:hypothetical protein